MTRGSYGVAYRLINSRPRGEYEASDFVRIDFGIAACRYL